MAEARATFVRTDSAGMVVDCDVATVDTMTRAGRADEAVAAARSIEAAVARNGDPTVAVTFGLHRALAELAASDAGGRARLLTTLADARAHRLPYDVHRSLAALLDLEDAGGPPAPEGACAENAELVERLGLRPGNPRVS